MLYCCAVRSTFSKIFYYINQEQSVWWKKFRKYFFLRHSVHCWGWLWLNNKQYNKENTDVILFHYKSCCHIYVWEDILHKKHKQTQKARIRNIDVILFVNSQVFDILYRTYLSIGNVSHQVGCQDISSIFLGQLWPKLNYSWFAKYRKTVLFFSLSR